MVRTGIRRRIQQTGLKSKKDHQGKSDAGKKMYLDEQG